MDDSEAVILLHGLVARSWMMLRLARHLRAAGFYVVNWSYPTLWKSIDEHASSLESSLKAITDDASIQRIHFVTHSMGSIIVRRLLIDHSTTKTGRFVMLGPPNRGSHVARTLSGRLSGLCPALQQLSDSPDSYVNQLPDPIGVEFGVIAAAKDLVVPIDNTRLANQADWMLLPGHHSALPWRMATLRHVTSFLRHGTFQYQIT